MEESVEAKKLLDLASLANDVGKDDLAMDLTRNSLLVLILGELRAIKKLLDTESESDGE